MAQHKKYNDSLTGYNSLKDPHLSSYFRKPQIRRHLLRANIINKENKIIEEISTTKHLQNIERKQKKELYHLLEEVISRKEQFSRNGYLASSDPTRYTFKEQEDLIKQAKIMFDSNPTANINVASSDADRSITLQRLDRMIRAIKEYDHIRSPEHHLLDLGDSLKYKRTYLVSDSKLKSSKSDQDLSGSQSFGFPLKPFSSSSQLSRESRPKSSYGRQGHGLNTSQPNLAHKGENELVETMKKSKSVVNIASYGDWKQNSATDDEHIESVEGDSWSDHGSDHGHSVGHLLSKPTNEKATTSRKYFSFDKKLTKNSSRQRVQMTLKYNGLNGATNRGVKRNVKVSQQVANGGNSILIYDGYVVPGDVFTFDIRPHPANSFAIVILVNGIRDLHMNTCCEHKHRPGTKLSHFTLLDVVGGRPCFACQSFDNERVDVKKYLDYFTFNELQAKDLNVSNDKDALEELNHNEDYDSLKSTKINGYLDVEKASEIRNKEQKTKTQTKEQNQDEAINSIESVAVQQDNMPHGEEHSREKFTGKQEQEQVQLVTLPNGEVASHLEKTSVQDLTPSHFAVMRDELEEMKAVDYRDISEETLPQVQSIDSDSDSDSLAGPQLPTEHN